MDGFITWRALHPLERQAMLLRDCVARSYAERLRRPN
jgi:hypothetical protein